MRRLYITAFALLLASCASGPTADAPRTAAPPAATPTQVVGAGATAAPAPATAATTAPEPTTAAPAGTPAPTPIPQPVPLGQVVQMQGLPGERYSIVVHELRRVAPDASLGFTEPWLFVDWSVRNDSEKDIRVYAQ